jgi:hypothetical protein
LFHGSMMLDGTYAKHTRTKILQGFHNLPPCWGAGFSVSDPESVQPKDRGVGGEYLSIVGINSRAP